MYAALSMASVPSQGYEIELARVSDDEAEEEEVSKGTSALAIEMHGMLTKVKIGQTLVKPALPESCRSIIAHFVHVIAHMSAD